MNYEIVYYREKRSAFKIIETVTVSDELLADYITSLQNMGNTIFAVFSKAKEN